MAERLAGEVQIADDLPRNGGVAAHAYLWFIHELEAEKRIKMQPA
jgi:hypothetical protein